MISNVIAGMASIAVARLQDALGADQGLTLAKVVANIPHDIGAVVVYAMLLGSAVLVWRAGRSKAGKAPTEPPQ